MSWGSGEVLRSVEDVISSLPDTHVRAPLQFLRTRIGSRSFLIILRSTTPDPQVNRDLCRCKSRTQTESQSRRRDIHPAERKDTQSLQIVEICLGFSCVPLGMVIRTTVQFTVSSRVSEDMGEEQHCLKLIKSEQEKKKPRQESGFQWVGES